MCANSDRSQSGPPHGEEDKSGSPTPINGSLSSPADTAPDLALSLHNSPQTWGQAQAPVQAGPQFWLPFSSQSRLLAQLEAPVLTDPADQSAISETQLLDLNARLDRLDAALQEHTRLYHELARHILEDPHLSGIARLRETIRSQEERLQNQRDIMRRLNRERNEAQRELLEERELNEPENSEEEFQTRSSNWVVGPVPPEYAERLRHSDDGARFFGSSWPGRGRAQ
ncbi:hypothetical protein F5Y13DRAFT_154341 [Hypoxylon sp. FL1857]|nr:hypothetical protein F5Y13DRAFT_154341 [Hypoxylon sp. FL1857]